jgi:hypothetical protein
MKYVPKYPALEAMPFNGIVDYYAIVDWMKACNDTHALADEVQYHHPIIIFPSIYGAVAVEPGDYVVRDMNNVFSKMDKLSFEANYVPFQHKPVIEVLSGGEVTVRSDLKQVTNDMGNLFAEAAKVELRRVDMEAEEVAVSHKEEGGWNTDIKRFKR